MKKGPSRNQFFQTILNAQDATGVGTAMNVSPYRYIVVSIASANSANLTVKCQHSIGSELGSRSEPTWASASSLTNQWDFCAIYDLEDASKIDGDTGVVFSGTDDVRLFKINTDNTFWINFRVTARSAGDVSIQAMAVDES